MLGESNAKVGAYAVPVQVPMEVERIPVAEVVVGEQQCREVAEDDSIGELAADIAAHGLLQPIGVVRVQAGGFQLVWGSRRLAAHRRLGWQWIEAKLLAGTVESVRGLALVENLHRSQLTLKEECDGVVHLRDVEGRSEAEISRLVGKSRTWVLRRLALAALPDDLRVSVWDGSLAIGSAEALARIESPSNRALLLQQCRSQGLSVFQVEAMVQVFEKSPNLCEAIEAGVEAARNAQAPGEIYLECAACRAPRPISRLALIRVCGDGCPVVPESGAGASSDGEGIVGG